jgi:hypothetical protein
VALQLEVLEDRLVLSTLPAPWADANIGAPPAQGSATYNIANATFTNTGAGTGNNGTSDQFNFDYQTLAGDGFIKAQVTPPTTPQAQSGLMIRDGLGASATFAELALTPSGAVFQHRDSVGAATSTTSLGAAPTWLEMVRNGNTVSAYLSPTGADGSWSLAATAGIHLGATLDFGMAVSSGNASQTASSNFQGASAQQTVPLGGNAGYANAFVDLTKDARQMNSPSWGTPPALDVNGNPTGDFRITLYESLQPGTYKVSFTGAPNTTLSGFSQGPGGTPGGTVTFTNQAYNSTTGKTTVDLNVGALPGGGNVTYLTLAFSSTGGTLQNLHIIRPGYDPANPPLYTNEFLSNYQSLGPTTLRYMDAAATNGNVVSDWSQRTLPTYAFPALETLTATVPVNYNNQQQTQTYTTATGLPWEYTIALSNALHADLWVNVPVQATDSYVQQLANLIQNGDTVGGVIYAGLAPDLNVYVEYSNELWNYGFTQAHMNLATAVNAVNGGSSNLNYDGSTNIYVWAQRQVAQRTVQISNDFAGVFGNAAMDTRVRVVLAGQGANSSEDPLKYVQNCYGTPSTYFYGLAQPSYFGLTAAQDNNPNLTPSQILADLQADVSGNVPRIQSFVTEANAWALHPLTYEGGPALGSSLGGVSNNHLQANVAAETDPQFANIVQQEIDAWYSAGGSLFNYYCLGEAPFGLGKPYGDWWVTDDINNQNEPKEVGFRTVRNSPLPALSGGFSTLPGELDGRNYSNNTDPLGNQGYATPWIGSWLPRDYSILASAPGTYQLRVNTPLSGTAQTVTVYVNGRLAGSVTTAAGSGVAGAPPVTVSLQQGFNTVRVTSPNGINTLQFLDANGDPLANTLPYLNLYSNGSHTPANQSYTITFGISDAETATSALSVTATSSNTTLVPNDSSHLKLTSGSYKGGKNEQLVITPASGQIGEADVTVTVTDTGGLSRSAVIHLLVQPTAPTGVTATSASPSKINLTWANQSTATGYQVDQSTDSSFGSNVTSWMLPAGTTSFSALGLNANTTYYYRVRSQGNAASGSSPYSPTVSATTAAAPAGKNPPSVATAASATLSSDGKSASLSVLGSDAAGEGTLTYTWSAIGPLPAQVSFSANGTNAAKNTTATFSAAGTYTFQVAITDGAGLATTSTVTVKVSQILNSYTVTPASTSVPDGGTDQMTPASFLDQFSHTMVITPLVTWSVGSGGVGGTISAWGLYTAPASGTGTATVVGLSNGVTRTVTITVTAPGGAGGGGGNSASGGGSSSSGASGPAVRRGGSSTAASAASGFAVTIVPAAGPSSVATASAGLSGGHDGKGTSAVPSDQPTGPPAPGSPTSPFAVSGLQQAGTTPLDAMMQQWARDKRLGPVSTDSAGSA